MALITDTGPMLALFDPDDRNHEPCRRLLTTAREEVVIPAPVLVELDYWLRRRVSLTAMPELLQAIERGVYRVEILKPEDYRRVAEILGRYADSGIDFVDAAVLAVAERRREPKVATLDRRHFGIMRPATLKPSRSSPTFSHNLPFS